MKQPREKEFERKCCLFSEGILTKTGKLVLQILLLILFFHFFGLPAVERFQRKEVMIVDSEKDNKGIYLPAITIAARNPQTQRGWRGPEIVNTIGDGCGDFDGTIDKCINEKTYNQSETVHDVLDQNLVSKFKRESLLDTTNGLSTEYAREKEGRYYTLDVIKRVGPAHQIYIALKYELIYQIFIHDPNFFILSYNPSLGSIMRVINPNVSTNHYYNLIMTEVEELDIPGDPCNTDRDYNFQARVGKSGFYWFCTTQLFSDPYPNLSCFPPIFTNSALCAELV